MARAKSAVKGFLDQLRKTGLKEAFFVVSLDDLPDQLPLFVLPLAEGADDKALTKFLQELDHGRVLHFEKAGDTLLAGGERAVRRKRPEKPAARPELARAFDAADRSP